MGIVTTAPIWSEVRIAISVVEVGGRRDRVACCRVVEPRFLRERPTSKTTILSPRQHISKLSRYIATACTNNPHSSFTCTCEASTGHGLTFCIALCNLNAASRPPNGPFFRQPRIFSMVHHLGPTSAIASSLVRSCHTRSLSRVAAQVRPMVTWFRTNAIIIMDVALEFLARWKAMRFGSATCGTLPDPAWSWSTITRRIYLKTIVEGRGRARIRTYPPPVVYSRRSKTRDIDLFLSSFTHSALVISSMEDSYDYIVAGIAQAR
jgi:hypothetical protein